MAKNELKRLSPLESILLPFLLMIKKGSEREKLRRRLEATQAYKKRRRQHLAMIKALKKECKFYEKLIVDAWIRIGEAWMLANAGIETGGRTPGRKKVQRVKFSRIFFNEEQVFFEIAVNKRWMHTTKNVLPHRVMVASLVSEQSIFELGHASRRMIKASYDDPRFGAWIIVNRLMGFDGIPLHVSYKEMLEFYPTDKMASAPLLLGAGENRKLVLFDLASHPHMLTGGSTRSGKSNFINTVICNFLRFSDPEQVKLVLIDLKRMEFGFYKEAPHLLRPTVFEAEEAIEVLDWLVTEIHRRADLMADKSKELSHWNKNHPDQAMPRIIVIIDEFAELMLASGKEIAHAVLKLTTRITNLGRASGVHLIIATQRPASDVVPNAIKINMPLIVAGRVQNFAQSAVILGVSDAAKLPQLPGRMVYSSGADVAQVQTPHIQDDEVLEAVAIAKGKAAGVIALDGIDPVILPAGLICYINDHLGGKLTAENLKRLKPLAVPSRALKEFIAEVIKAGGFVAGDREFNIVRREGNYYELWESGPTRPAPVFIPEFPELPAPRLLMLPAPRPPVADADPVEPEPAPPAQPEPAPVVHPLVMTEDQVLDEFIKRCCEVGPRYSATKADLYAAYRAFCKDLDADIEPMTDVKMGRRLLAKKLKRVRVRNITVYKGLKLLINSDLSESSQSDPGLSVA